MQAGVPFAHEVEFSTGLPTGAITYSVLGHDNQPLPGYNGLTLAPPNGAVSVVLIVPGEANTCTKPLFEGRTLRWSYPTSIGIVHGGVQYRVEKAIPFPVTPHGVRTKLGVEDHEIEDNEINLLLAYATITKAYGAATIDGYAAAGDLNTLIVTEAIEAQAALFLLPSLQLAVARSEDSGTNKYQRFTSIDWQVLADGLNQTIGRIDTMLDLTTDNLLGTVFIAVGRTTDPLTNSDYVV